MNKLTATFLTVLAVSWGPAALAAPGEVALKGDVKLEKTVTDAGVSRTVLVDPKVVVPGDKLLFTTRYVNNGAVPAKNFVVTNPVPAAVSVAAESAGGLNVSVDGGKAFGKLAALSVKGADGKLRAATATDVTHIRWTVATIAPGGTGAVEYHAIVR